MTFETVDALESYILSRINVAIQEAQAKVYEVIHEFVKKYYAGSLQIQQLEPSGPASLTEQTRISEPEFEWDFTMW